MRSFAELLLPGHLLHALKAGGYQRPSPVQVLLGVPASKEHATALLALFTRTGTVTPPDRFCLLMPNAVALNNVGLQHSVATHWR